MSRWFLLLCCCVVLSAVGCSQQSECRFDGDCSASGARCVAGTCVTPERVVVENTPPEVQPPEIECQDGHQRACFSGTSGQLQGICQQGKQFCVDGQWSECQGEVLPKAKETCNNLDDNCNGTVDEGCDCKPGDEKECYTGPAGTDNKGLCQRGKQICGSNGQWGTCDGSVTPVQEECNNKDDNCDGAVDEALSQDCYDGPDNTAGIGVCKQGRRACENGQWGACTGQIKPGQETCDNGKDDDCDGTIDEGPGRALAFSGTGQSVTIPHHNDLNLTGSFTIEVWYNFAGLGNTALMILVNKHQSGEDTSGYHLKIENPNNECAFSWWKANTGGLLRFGTCPTNRWAHIAFVYDHKLLQYHFYIDGTRVKNGQLQQPLDIGANNYPLMLGTESGSSGNPDYQGKLASIRISRTARYTGDSFSPTCTYANDTQTLGLWNLDDGGGKQVKDLSSLSNHGTLTGATWDIGRSCNAAKPGEGCVK